MTDALSQTTTYTYDNMDRVDTRTDPLTIRQHGPGGYSDRSAYDAFDRRTLTTYDDSSTTAYTYDDGDRLIGIDDSVAGWWPRI